MGEFEKESFARAILNGTYDLEVVAPVDDEAALQEVIADVDGMLALNDYETRQRRHKHFNVTGTTEASYYERLFELNSARPFLAGIRHAGGNPNLPFVSVTLGFQLTDQDMPAIVEILKNEFQPFHPGYLAIWMKPEAEQYKSIDQFRPVRRYLARRIKDLNFSLNDSNQIEVRPMNDESYFPWYESEYRKFHDSNPDLTSWVTISEKDDLEKYRNQGLLYGAYLDSELVGLVGGENQGLLGLRGLYVGELLISARHKGKGFAVEMQRQFIERVGENFEVVWGTIDARNIPSTRTALRIGRKPMRTEFFVPLG